ncbi:hypothetical protein OQA88_11732 [Cercophora sp. LCS_1]
MASSRRSGSSSSFNSSSLGAPPSFNQHVSPPDLTFTPTSAVSAVTSESSAPATPLGPLDLGPPGYNATIKLFERTTTETTVFLGPYEVVSSEPRRVVWQCSYAGEVLEHFLPSDFPADIFPFTLHAQHRRFGDPREMELYLGFREPHRVRYTTVDGVLHDEYIEVNYVFTTIESSMQFQGDIRGKDLVDWYDIDVVWSDSHRRTDSYGNLNARGARRGSASESSHSHGRERRFSASSLFRTRSSGTPNHSPSSVHQSEVRHLGIQFTRNERMTPGTDDYRRFIEAWNFAHDTDDQFDIPLPSSVAELESPVINGMSDVHSPFLNGVSELPSPEMFGSLPPVPEPSDYADMDSDGTP